MSFILLRRTTEGEIHLLSNTSWSGRGDAMAELSRITAAPSFDRWDDEVLLVDVDSGTPILMVRPAAVEEPAPEVVAEEPAPEADVADAGLAEGEEDVSEAPADGSSEVAAELLDVAADEPEPPAPSTDDEIAALLEDLEAPEVASSAAPSLKEALERSAARLEAEGIVAPESVGPAPETAPDEAESEATTAEAADAEAESESVVDEAPAAWPWDTATEEKTFDLDAFEESHDQSESLVRAPGDDETLSFAKPVILGGEYAAVVPEAVVETPAPEPITETPVTEPIAETPAADAGAEPEATASDFIDLGPAEPAAPAPMVSEELAALTCDDCVYDSTCPNRGQLLPASCGSFQWK